jgi:hypothetical protein
MTEYRIQHGVSTYIDGPRSCGCCEGVATHSHLVSNRPGLDSLKYRVGTYSTFFDDLVARVATFTSLEKDSQPGQSSDGQSRSLALIRRPAGTLVSNGEQPPKTALPELRSLLTTREKSDFAIALFDAWATLADVISFYQERLANEGFLRTAQDPRSLYELSRLIGYTPRPGVSSSVYLAFEVDGQTTLPQGLPSAVIGSSYTGGDNEIVIPAGTAAKSTPTPGSTDEPQTFETTDDLLARTQWNYLLPRKTRPQRLTSETAFEIEKLYKKNTGLRIERNAILAIEYAQGSYAIRRVADVDEISERSVTVLTLELDDLTLNGLTNEIALLTNHVPKIAFPEITSTELVKPETTAELGIVNQRFSELRQALAGAIEEIFASKPNSLSILDDKLQKFICDKLFSLSSPVRVPFKRFRDAVDELTKDDTTTLRLSNLLLYKDVTDRFKWVAKSLFEVYQRTDVALTGARNSLSAAKKGKQLSGIKFALDSLCNTPRSSLSISANPDGVPQSTTPLQSIEQVNNLSPATGPQLTAKVEFLRNTAVLALADANYHLASNDIVPTSGQSHSTNTLLTAIQNVTVSATADADYRVQIFNSTQLLAECVQRTLPAGSSTFNFTITPPETVQVCPISSDVNLALLATASTVPTTSLKARFRLTSIEGTSIGSVTGGVGPYTFISPSAGEFVLGDTTNTDTSFPNFLAAFNSVKYHAGNSAGHVSILLEIFSASAMSASNQLSSAVIDVFVIPSGLERDPVALAQKRLTDLHNEIAVPGASANVSLFDSEWWPGTGNTVAQAGQDIYGTGGLADQVVSAKLGDALGTISDKIPHSSGSTPLEQRRDRLRAVFETVATDSLNNGSEVHPLADNSSSPPKVGIATILDRAEAQTVTTGTSVGSVALLADSEDYLLSVVDSVNDYVSALIGSVSGLTIGDPIAKLKTAVGLIDHAQTPINAAANDLKNRSESFEAPVLRFANDIASSLNARRKTFLSRGIQLLERLTELVKSAGSAPYTDRLVAWLNYLLDKWQPLRAELDVELKVTKCDEVKKYALSDRVSELHKQLDETAEPAATPSSPKNVEETFHLLNNPKLDNQLNRIRRLSAREEEPDKESTATVASALSVADAVTKLEQLRLNAGGNAAPRLTLDLLALIDSRSDFVAQLSAVLSATQRDFLYGLLRNARIDESTAVEPKLYVFGSQANVFGWNAPASAPTILDELSSEVACLSDSTSDNYKNADKVLSRIFALSQADEAEADTRLFLDGSFQRTGPNSVIAIQQQGVPETESFSVRKALMRPRNAYGVRGNATELELSTAWWRDGAKPDMPELEEIIRTTRVYCDAEYVTLAEAPEPDFLDNLDTIVCDALVVGLEVGRQLVVEGVPQLSAGEASVTRQLVRVVKVDHAIDETLFGDTYHTEVTVSPPLTHRYRRDSVKIYANVVAATHGESQREVLGSGDATRAFQAFRLQRPELSQLPAPTPTGAEAALHAYINDVEWKTDTGFGRMSASAEQFVPIVDDSQLATLVFGDGEHGARLPTGIQNVRASYRTGLGIRGNVAAGQIDQAVGAPLGVRKVINPLSAQGGADPDNADMVRVRAPLALSAMDRLVSVHDYADFARNYAGIGKASARRIQGVVHVTVAGLASEPFDMEGPVIRNLRQTLQQFGDPSQRYELHDRESSLLIVAAKIGLLPGFNWNPIEPLIRTALLDAFSYENADLGGDILISDAINAIQAINGVNYVDIDTFDSVDQNSITDLAARLNRLKRRSRIHVQTERLEYAKLASSGGSSVQSGANSSPSSATLQLNQSASQQDVLHPAQLCFLPPDIPSALLLEWVR